MLDQLISPPPVFLCCKLREEEINKRPAAQMLMEELVGRWADAPMQELSITLRAEMIFNQKITLCHVNKVPQKWGAEVRAHVAAVGSCQA